MCPSTVTAHARGGGLSTAQYTCSHMSLTAKVIDIKIAFNCSVLEYSHSSEDVLTLYLVCTVTMDQPLVIQSSNAHC